MLVTVKYTRSHLSRKATGHITMNIGKRSSIPSLYQFLPIQCINDVTTERSLLTMRRWRNNNAALGHKIDFRTVVLTLLSRHNKQELIINTVVPQRYSFQMPRVARAPIMMMSSSSKCTPVIMLAVLVYLVPAVGLSFSIK
jgi:hypothetical protein